MKTYQIKSYHHINIDSYTEGELDCVNYYMLESSIRAESPREALEKYFDIELNYSFNYDDGEIYDTNDYFEYSVLVNHDNEEATPAEVEKWKDEKIILYINSISLKVFELINVTSI